MHWFQFIKYIIFFNNINININKFINNFIYTFINKKNIFKLHKLITVVLN